MMNIHTLSQPAEAAHYFSATDYYPEGHERPGTWHGDLRKEFKLEGIVEMETFASLCRRQHPETGKPLTNARDKEAADFARDFTFSPPKSVSVAGLVAGDERVLDAHDRAVLKTMEIAQALVETRVRKGGADYNRTTANWLFGMFRHGTARPEEGIVDPQYHNHCVVFSLTRDPVENEVKSINFRELKRQAPTIQAVYRSLLEGEMRQLGYETRQVVHVNENARTKKKSYDYSFELSGVPQEAIDEFSRRTAKINGVAAQLDKNVKAKYGPEAHLTAEAKAKLAATSRSPKLENPPPFEELQQSWRERLSPEVLQAVLATGEAAKAPVLTAARDKEAVEHAFEHVLYRESTAEPWQVVGEALRYGLAKGASLEGVQREMGRMDVIRSEVKGTERVTTQAVAEEEKAILRFVIDGRGRCKERGERGWIMPETLTPGRNEPPMPGQKEAIRYVLESPDRFQLITGRAGVGKTKTMRAAFDRADQEPVVLAPTTDAVDVLKENGFPQARTVASFLASKDAQDEARDNTVLIDELGMVGTQDLSRVVKSVAQLNGRIVGLADPRQHRSVSRGDVIDLIRKNSGIPVVELNEIVRQKGENLKAANLMAEGKIRQAFEKYDDMGAIVETQDALAIPREAMHADGLPLNPVERYVQLAYLAPKKQGVVFVVPTHAEGAEVNDAIRGRLKELGIVHGEEREFKRLVDLQWSPPEVKAAKERKEEGVEFGKFAAYRPDTIKLAAGDRIRITGNGKKDVTGEHQLRNGSVYDVAGFTKEGCPKLANGWVLPEDFGLWRYAHVSTTFKAQGKTEPTIALMNERSFPVVDMRAAYVAVTRAPGVKPPMMYTDSKPELRQMWERADPHVHAIDLLKPPKPKPKRRLRDRIKKHLAFLRQSVSFSPEPSRDMSRQQERGMGRER